MATAALRPYVPDLAVEWLQGDPESLHRRVEGSMAFVDLSGFTTLTERLTRHGAVGSEELSDMLDSTFAALLAEARDERADLVKWGGDAVLLLFRGADHAVRAVRAAVGMRHVLYRVGRTSSTAGSVTLRMSVGIHSGQFDFFLVGDPVIHRELLVSGPAATRVAELESEARAGQIVVSPQTATLLPPHSVAQLATGNMLVRRATPRGRTVGTTDGHDFGHEDRDTEVDVAQLLAPPVRAHLLARAGTAEHRPVAVAFVRFSGTDALVTTGGTQAAATELDGLVRHVQEVCARHGVTFLESDIDRDGGKIMLVCGAPTRAEDLEDRLVRAVRQIVDGGGGLRLQAGVNRGRVFASDFGPPFRRTYSVKGDAINVAARVTGRAVPGQVLATRAVLARAGRGVVTAEVPPFRVKGRSRPVEGAAVISLRPVGESLPVPDGTTLGRERELDAIMERVAEARAGQGQIVEVCGGPGLGKSAVVSAVVDRCADTVVVLNGPSRRFGGAASYQVFRRLLRQVVGAHPGDPTETQLEALRRAVESAAPHVLPWFPLLASMIGAQVPDTPELRDLDDHFRPGRAARAVTDLLEAALTGPTLFVMDAADDMDDASTGVVRELVAARERRPWVFLLTRRVRDKGFVPDPQEEHLVLELSPLAETTCLELLTAWVQEQPLGDQQLRAVAAKSGGNPLHLRALLELAVVRGTVEGLPDGVEEVIGAEIDELSPRARTVLRFASVLGERFDLHDLTALFGREDWSYGPEELRELTGHLVRERATDTWYRFSSTLLHDVAYAGLPYRLRRRLHLWSGEALEASGADPVPVEALSTHFFGAGDHGRALTYSVRAAERARQASSSLEALAFYERALVCAARAPDVTPTLVGQLQEAAGDAAEMAGLTSQAISRYRTARTGLRQDALAAGGVMAKEIALHQRAGDFDRSTRIAAYARRSLDAVVGPEADSLRSRLAVQTAFVDHLRSRHAQAMRWSRIAIDQALRSGDQAVLARAYNAHSLILAVAGVPADQPYGELALASSERSGDLRLQAKCLTNLAISAIIDGRWPEAEQLLARAVGLAERLGDAANVANVTYNRCDVLVRQGRWAEATPLLASVAREARAQDDRELVALVGLELGKVFAGQRRWDEARSRLQAARSDLLELGLERESADAELVALACDVASAATAADRDRVGAALRAALEGPGGAGAYEGRARLHLLHGTLLLGAGQPVTAEAAFEAGTGEPPGEGGFDRALNQLGLAEAATADGRSRSTDRARAEEALARLGVRDLPFGLRWSFGAYTAPR